MGQLRVRPFSPCRGTGPSFRPLGPAPAQRVSAHRLQVETGSEGTDMKRFCPHSRSTLPTATPGDWPSLQLCSCLSPEDRGGAACALGLEPRPSEGQCRAPLPWGLPTSALHPTHPRPLPVLRGPGAAALLGTPSSEGRGPGLPHGHRRSSSPRDAGTASQPWRRLGAAQAVLVSDILRIDNLWPFENLRKLQLDNNVIEKIEGLERLTRLVWLGERGPRLTPRRQGPAQRRPRAGPGRHRHGWWGQGWPGPS